MIAENMTNKKFQATIKELFIRGRKVNISLENQQQNYKILQLIICRYWL